MQIEGYTIDSSAERRKYIKHLMKRYNVNVNIDKTFLNQAKRKESWQVSKAIYRQACHCSMN